MSDKCLICEHVNKIVDLEQQNKQLKKEIECLEAKVKNILTPYDESERLLVGLINERDQLQQQNIELKNRISELAGELTVQLSNNHELESNWKDSSNRLVNMTRDWYTCANTNTELRIENTNLREKNKQLRDTLSQCKKFLFYVKFYPDGCECYEEYECQRCRTNKLWSLVDKLMKEDS